MAEAMSILTLLQGLVTAGPQQDRPDSPPRTPRAPTSSNSITTTVRPPHAWIGHSPAELRHSRDEDMAREAGKLAFHAAILPIGHAHHWPR